MTPPAAVTSAVMPVMSAVTFSGVHIGYLLLADSFDNPVNNFAGVLAIKFSGLFR